MNAFNALLCSFVAAQLDGTQEHHALETSDEYFSTRPKTNTFAQIDAVAAMYDSKDHRLVTVELGGGGSRPRRTVCKCSLG